MKFTFPAVQVEISLEVRRKFFEECLDCVLRQDEHGLKELWDEWDSDHKAVLWGLFSPQQRRIMKDMLRL